MCWTIVSSWYLTWSQDEVYLLCCKYLTVLWMWTPYVEAEFYLTMSSSKMTFKHANWKFYGDLDLVNKLNLQYQNNYSTFAFFVRSYCIRPSTTCLPVIWIVIWIYLEYVYKNDLQKTKDGGH